MGMGREASPETEPSITVRDLAFPFAGALDASPNRRPASIRLPPREKRADNAGRPVDRLPEPSAIAFSAAKSSTTFREVLQVFSRMLVLVLQTRCPLFQHRCPREEAWVAGSLLVSA
ncbi:MAG: hypothetical protein JST54_20585 [Deltaproteobacteria bacterium]|nr:hypothetical protein [Deltaproteobacteria bacterium]